MANWRLWFLLTSVSRGHYSLNTGQCFTTTNRPTNRWLLFIFNSSNDYFTHNRRLDRADSIAIDLDVPFLPSVLFGLPMFPAIANPHLGSWCATCLFTKSCFNTRFPSFDSFFPLFLLFFFVAFSSFYRKRRSMSWFIDWFVPSSAVEPFSAPIIGTSF